MSKRAIWKDFFTKTVIPVVLALLLFYAFQTIFTKDGERDYVLIWLFCGIPFGIRRMFVWIVPRGGDLSWTLGITAINFIVGGLIGGVILIWRLMVAAWYVPLTLYRLLASDQYTSPQSGTRE